jgi:broad specificity phosphatase PhoE
VTIVLVRHGETALNVARVLQPAATPLSERGLAQAARLAEHVATLAPAALVASDLPRAWQTAQAIAAATRLAIEAEPLLQERNFGDWRGQAWDAVGIDPYDHPGAPPGGESMADFERRAAAAWDLVVARREKLAGPLVVVSHGLLIHRWLAAHATVPPELPVPARLGNASVSVLAETSPHLVSRVGCTLHLEFTP